MNKTFLTMLTGVLCISSYAQADINLNQLAGSYSANCTQSQSSTHASGYLIETYTFASSGNYQLTRQWYADSACATPTTADNESGSIVIGSEDTNHGFNPAGTFDTQYKTANGVELGLLWVNANYTQLRVARGFGSSQNTMLGMFQYTKRN